MPTRDRLAGKTKQGATSIVKFGWQISITKAMFINNAPYIATWVSWVYKRAHCDVSSCYVKCQPEIYWLVQQSKVQHLLLILVGTLVL
jgi:hypothetical protein